MTAAAVVPSTGFALSSTPGPFLGGGNPNSLSGFGFATAPFGTPTATPGIGFSTFGQQALPFGTVAFGGGKTSSAPIPSPFGANSGGWQGGTTSGQGHANKQQPCKFFASGKCKYGESCKFSHDIGGMNNGQISGGSDPSPFGNISDNGGGGGGNPSRTMGGVGDGKQICKFFASGQCRNGSGCHFSHELPSNTGSMSSFGSRSNNQCSHVSALACPPSNICC